MQLPSSLTEQPRFLRVNSTNQFLHELGRPSSVKAGFAGENALVIAAHRVESKFPRVTFVRDRRLNEREHDRLFPGTIFERSAKRRHVREFCAFGQKSCDLNVGINPLFQFTKDFQKIFVTEQNGGVALFRSHHARISAQIRRRRELSRCRSNDFAASRSQSSLLANDAINLAAIVGIKSCVVQYSVAIGECGDDRMLGFARNAVRIFIARNLQGQRVNFRRSFSIIYFNQNVPRAAGMR